MECGSLINLKYLNSHLANGTRTHQGQDTMGSSCTMEKAI